MLTSTLRDGLDAYAIGPKLRGLRLKKKLGLVELGKHTSLSPAMLSKIERGRLFPTLPTLLRISLVFGVGLDYFFLGAREKPVVGHRAASVSDCGSPTSQGSREPAFHFESLDFAAVERKTSAYLADFPPVASEKVRLHQHQRRRVHLRAARHRSTSASGMKITSSTRTTRCTSTRPCRTATAAAAHAPAARLLSRRCELRVEGRGLESPWALRQTLGSELHAERCSRSPTA